ncbi:hypothetical protein MN608_11106 [Microdochium nivale]|nr:hypothetical protein MN608_11106 [Microdochium nivale]
MCTTYEITARCPYCHQNQQLVTFYQRWCPVAKNAGHWKACGQEHKRYQTRPTPGPCEACRGGSGDGSWRHHGPVSGWDTDRHGGGYTRGRHEYS